MGGLIIKAALADAREGSDNDQAIRNSSAGLFFFGVPHKGLKNENVLSLVKGQPNAQLLQNLEENSHFLKLAYNNFLRDELDDCPITSFYETQLSPTVKVRLDAFYITLRANYLNS